ncbi:MAG: flagellar basal body rod C-terminal domain-containing protein [Candidatus Gastranaerophilales bacterium]|nr:flagellar basal body rod C-terminal domain-containing protein [Candidatus Gastranaerophilales bacterium]
MYLRGGINFIENGLTCNIRAMHLQTELMGITSENINGFDKIGYQRKDPVVSSFSEYIGAHGLSTAIDDTVGRLGQSENPLDIALGNKGYFQYLGKHGVKLSRDGRLKVDKTGNLMNEAGEKVLANDGTAIKLPFLPDELSQIKIDTEGNVSVFNKKTNKLDYVSTLSVVTTEGVAVMAPNVRQGFNEFSNVSLSTEFMQAMPIVRNFDANRQLYQMQANLLSKAVQQLGS